MDWFKSCWIGAMLWCVPTLALALDGSIEYAQTHVIKEQDERLGPQLLAERETLLLFTPSSVLDFDDQLWVKGVFEDGTSQSLIMMPPEQLPRYKEQVITEQALPAYSQSP